MLSIVFSGRKLVYSRKERVNLDETGLQRLPRKLPIAIATRRALGQDEIVRLQA